MGNRIRIPDELKTIDDEEGFYQEFPSNYIFYLSRKSNE